MRYHATIAAAVLLADIASAAKLPFDVHLPAINGIFQFHESWQGGCKWREFDPPRQININATRKILSFDAQCTSVSLSVDYLGYNHKESALSLRAEGSESILVDLINWPRRVEAVYNGMSQAHVDLWRCREKPDIYNDTRIVLLYGATVGVELETDATIMDDVEVHEEPFVGGGDAMSLAYVGDWDTSDTQAGIVGSGTVSIPITPGTAYVKLKGHLGPQFGRANVTVSSSSLDGNTTRTTSRFYSHDNCSTTAVLWMSPLDPTANHTLHVTNADDGKIGLSSIASYASAWDKPCSQSVRPGRCRLVRFRRWVGRNWIIGSVALFLFFLIKGLAWLALGGGVFVSIRGLWRRFTKSESVGEREPLLGASDGDDQEAVSGQAAAAEDPAVANQATGRSPV